MHIYPHTPHITYEDAYLHQAKMALDVKLTKLMLKLTSHIENGDIHVTADDKKKWNNMVSKDEYDKFVEDIKNKIGSNPTSGTFATLLDVMNYLKDNNYLTQDLILKLINDSIKNPDLSGYLTQTTADGRYVLKGDLNTAIATYVASNRDLLKGDKGDKGDNGADGVSIVIRPNPNCAAIACDSNGKPKVSSYSFSLYERSGQNPEALFPSTATKWTISGSAVPAAVTSTGISATADLSNKFGNQLEVTAETTYPGFGAISCSLVLPYVSDGKNGTAGVQGEKGDKGDPGTDGKNGKPGDKGDKGDKGDTGDTGKPGKDGENGHSPYIGTDGYWYYWDDNRTPEPGYVQSQTLASGGSSKQGLAGCVLRNRGQWDNSVADYVNMSGYDNSSDPTVIRYIDYVYYDGSYYMVKALASGTNTATAGSAPSANTTLWSKAKGDEFEYIKTLISDLIAAKSLTANEVIITDNTSAANVQAGMTSSNAIVTDGTSVNVGSVRIWAGPIKDGELSTAPFTVDSNGHMKASNADITGTINAVNGSFNGTVKATAYYLGITVLNDETKGYTLRDKPTKSGDKPNTFSNADMWGLGEVYRSYDADFNKDFTFFKMLPSKTSEGYKNSILLALPKPSECKGAVVKVLSIASNSAAAILDAAEGAIGNSYIVLSKDEGAGKEFTLGDDAVYEVKDASSNKTYKLRNYSDDVVLQYSSASRFVHKLSNNMLYEFVSDGDYWYQTQGLFVDTYNYNNKAIMYPITDSVLTADEQG